MKIECPQCRKVYDIPDERLPDKQTFSFSCPACKGMITVNGPGEKAGDLPKGEALKKQILRKLTALPAMPQTVMKARNIMSNERSSFDQLARALETDQAIASKLLRLSNSSYYGMRGKIASIQHASVVLGFKTLKEIITLAGSSSLLANKLEGYGLDAGDLWQHSLGAAFAAKLIARKKCPELAEDAFVAGLIHDCGKLVLDEAILERKGLFERVLANGAHSFLKAEKTILGFDHPEMAYALCKSWNIPESLGTAIRYHHAPSRSGNDRMTFIVHIADALAMMSGLGAGIDAMAYEMDPKAMAAVGLGEEDLPSIMAQMVESVIQVTDA